MKKNPKAKRKSEKWPTYVFLEEWKRRRCFNWSRT
jgi:hypothetical protein